MQQYVSIQLAMREFAPDGAWAEGPGYWNYAATYNVAFLGALQTALGTDCGLGDIAGFAEAGMFPIHFTGPLNRTFNYADGSDSAIRAPHMFWLARRFNQPAYVDLLWCRESPSDSSDLGLNKHFRETEVVTLRSAWNDPSGLFVGFKGGDNKANHAILTSARLCSTRSAFAGAWIWAQTITTFQDTSAIVAGRITGFVPKAITL